MTTTPSPPVALRPRSLSTTPGSTVITEPLVPNPHQLGSKQTGPINPGAKRERDFQHKSENAPKRPSPTQWSRFLEERDRARKAAEAAIRKKYFPELPEPRASSSTTRPSRAQANIAASEAIPDDEEDPFFPDQDTAENSHEYTDDEYFAMMVAKGHFDTEVEDFSRLDDADNK